MTRRSSVGLQEIAAVDNLALAFSAAARGHWRQAEVRAFAADLDAKLADLRQELLALSFHFGDYKVFRIHDPKPRCIHAPCFRERVVHHAIMAQVGPVLDRALVDRTFACRKGKGSLAALNCASSNSKRWPWFVKTDVRSYFASIDHLRLRSLLARRFRSARLLELLDQVIGSHETSPGKGLPIGALTSQHFANFYLNELDRYLLEVLRVPGMVRYMDDIVWWTRTLADARAAALAVRPFVNACLGLQLRADLVIQRTALGMSFLGFRVFPQVVRLSRRRRRRYTEARRRWEEACRAGAIDPLTLQKGYAAVLAITAGADAAGFRAAELLRHPPVDA